MTFNDKTGKKLYDALKALASEASGFLSQSSVESHGVTNQRVLERKIAAAREALAAAEVNPKVTEEFALSQIERLAGMRRFPAKKTAVLNDMIEAVMQHNPDEEIVREVMDMYARDYSGEDYCPSAGDIARAITDAITRRDGPLCWDVNCEQCSGSGFLNQGRGPKCNCLKRRKVNRYRQEVAVP